MFAWESTQMTSLSWLSTREPPGKEECTHSIKKKAKPIQVLRAALFNLYEIKEFINQDHKPCAEATQVQIQMDFWTGQPIR